MATRKCKHKYCLTRVSADEKFCEIHNSTLAEYAEQWSETMKQLTKEVMDEQAPILSKLKDTEPVPEELINKVNWYETKPNPNMTLPSDSRIRKEYPLLRGCLRYFPAALAGVAHISHLGNEKHNPGQPLHHARGKSTDHGDCIIRHLIDLQDLLAAKDRSCLVSNADILAEASSLAWRALALSQELHESLGAPMAPGAKD
jgi:hypothetical protein